MQRPLMFAMTLTLAGCFSGSALGNVVVDTYSAMDDSNDGVVSKAEFHEYFLDASVFEAMDVNDDDRLGKREFGNGLFQHYDDDHDGYIDDAEWQDGIMVDDYGDHGFWDM